MLVVEIVCAGKIVMEGKMTKYLIRESISGTMHYCYSIEANSEEEAMEIYETTYPSNDDSEFYPDDNGEISTEIVEE